MSHKQNNHQDNATPRKDETMDGNAAVLDDVREALTSRILSKTKKTPSSTSSFPISMP